MMRLVFLFLSVVALVSAVLPQPYTHHALMDNIQTGNSTSTATGAAIFSCSSTNSVCQYTIVNNVVGATAAHIHCPAIVNSTAPPVATIAEITPNGNNNVATGAVTLSGANFGYMDAGLCYLNIHSTAYPNGEVRGQVLGSGSQLTMLTGQQDNVPTPAYGLAWMNYNSGTKNLTWVVVHNVPNATAAHLHGPAPPGSNAGIICPIAATQAQAAQQPYVGYCILNSANETYLHQGMMYYNVHSVANPGGEIRGQVIPPVNCLADLDGSQDNQNTTERGVGGCAQYGTNTLWAAIYHTVPPQSVNSSHIHQGPPGQNGPIVWTFTNYQAMPIQESFPNVTSDQASNLTKGNDYFNIHTMAAPGGLIRGQIYPKQSDQPPSTTSSTSGTTSSSNATSTGSLTSSTGTTHATTSSASLVAYSLGLVFCAVAILMF